MGLQRLGDDQTKGARERLDVGQGLLWPEHHAEHLAAVNRLAEAGVFKPAIGARFALAQAREALAAMAARTVTGKIVVSVAAR